MPKPNLKTVIAVILLVASLGLFLHLGFWQIERLAWKTDIIKKLDTIYQADASTNIYHFDDLTIMDNQDIPILYGTVEGQFDYSKEILAGPKPYDNKVGYQVITPLNLKQGGVLLISRGYIDVEQKHKINKTHIHKDMLISGLIRQPDWTKFTPKNSPENNVWSRLDIDEISQAKGIREVAPVMMYAEKSSIDIPLLTLQETRWMPHNKHRQYALFWFTSAFVLCLLFGLYIRGRQKNLD